MKINFNKVLILVVAGVIFWGFAKRGVAVDDIELAKKADLIYEAVIVAGDIPVSDEGISSLISSLGIGEFALIIQGDANIPGEIGYHYFLDDSGPCGIRITAFGEKKLVFDKTYGDQ